MYVCDSHIEVVACECTDDTNTSYMKTVPYSRLSSYSWFRGLRGKSSGVPTNNKVTSISTGFATLHVNTSQG